MTSQLSNVLETLYKITERPRAACAIVSPDGTEECQLMGTKDGFLNLAISLLEIVRDSLSQGNAEGVAETIPEESAVWSQHISKAIHDIPGRQPFVTGAILFQNHEAFVSSLEVLVQNLNPAAVSLRNDPQFYE
jgi:hypothetical protein